MTPGGHKTPSTTLYVVTQENCINCPAAKAIVKEAIEGTPVPMEEVNLQTMDPDFEFRLLESQIFIASTPSIILGEGESLKLLYTGTLPSVEDIRSTLGVS